MYKLLEHPSDIIVEGKNKTFEKALQDVANGMFTQMGEKNAKEKDKIEIVSEKANNEDLVVDVLSNIIAECESLPFKPKKAEVSKISEHGVKITVHGERIQPENIIKAVTYHELQIRREKSGWTIRVLFDI